MFIQPTDLQVVITPQALQTLSQAQPATIQQALLQAQEEVAGYLRPTYDTDAIFTPATPHERNPQLVMLTADIALYHLSASLPQKMGADIRLERYQRAIKWLEGVAAGKIVPDLPRAEGGTTQPNASSPLFHSEPHLRHTW